VSGVGRAGLEGSVEWDDENAFALAGVEVDRWASAAFRSLRRLDNNALYELSR